MILYKDLTKYLYINLCHILIRYYLNSKLVDHLLVNTDVEINVPDLTTDSTPKGHT